MGRELVFSVAKTRAEKMGSDLLLLERTKTSFLVQNTRTCLRRNNSAKILKSNDGNFHPVFGLREEGKIIILEKLINSIFRNWRFRSQKQNDPSPPEFPFSNIVSYLLAKKCDNKGGWRRGGGGRRPSSLLI